ncbi:hypothetical protein C0Q70_09842 [Pomacea canaliculata]|uniref:Neurotransmitter-gated ion-channel transmembrane domain-containing protein n=1 Tax=Pomacea canaliculata TaxID=400727 RepID=A0A2T7PAX4_POMCA|nr:hypothetical protein C0Q70_09842 [Pomacea canaliculata]
MTIFIVSFATGMTVFTLNIHHKGVRGKEVPAVVKMICFRFLARIFCIRVESSMPEGPSVDHKQPSEHLNMSRLDVKLETETSHSSPGATGEMVSGLQRMRQSINNVSSPPSGGGSGSLGQGDPFELQFSRVLQRVNQTIERNEIRLMEQDKREVIKLEWQQVALIADRVLLVCFVTATVTITGVVLFQSPPSAKV